MSNPAADDLADRFTYHPPTAEQPDYYRLIRDAGHLLALVILHTAKPSRNRELAIEHVESAVMRANAAIARLDLADSAATRTPEELVDVCWDALFAANPNTQLPGHPTAGGDDDPDVDPWLHPSDPQTGKGKHRA